MLSKNTATAALAAVVLSACASAFSPLPEGSIFPPPPANADAMVKVHFESILKDPDSARYKVSPPYKAFANYSLVEGGGLRWKGYAVDVQVNAKNSYGGYTGFKPYIVLINENGNGVFRAVPGETHPLIKRVW